MILYCLAPTHIVTLELRSGRTSTGLDHYEDTQLQVMEAKSILMIDCQILINMN